MTQNIQCPVCGSTATLIKVLDHDYLRNEATKFVGDTCCGNVEWKNYELWRCSSCSLEFSQPMLPGGDDLYEWLNCGGHYYLEDRWEWGRVEVIIRNEAASRPVKVLEFGAGDGSFLMRLKDAGVHEVVAIERSEEVAARLREQGITAYGISDAMARVGELQFDFVLSFHCLEHVDDPKHFIEQKRLFAGSAGRIFFSVPYSPMHFETRMFDPLNHPPHHLTRWNTQSLTILASETGHVASMQSPPAFALLRRVRHALYCARYGPQWPEVSLPLRLLALLRPIALTQEYLMQRRRHLLNGDTAGDVVLVEFTIKEDTL